MKRIAIVIGLLIAVAALVVVARAGRSPADHSRVRVDEIFAEWNRTDSPGCSVGVSRNGVPVHERGYGMANLDLNAPITPSSVFEAASISKQFTAMSIAILAQRGQLSFDDQARKYLPELPDYGRPLTVRHLLGHTSGLRDAFLLLELSAPRESADQNDVLLELLARQGSLNFPPGAEWQYNNGGYALLAIIVTRVSGMSLADFARANIFNPLGMTSTWFQDDPALIMPNRASNYSREAGHWRFVPDGTARGAVGNSGLWTTTRDLLRWQQNFADERVGAAPLLAEMQTSATLTGGKPTNWGLGFEVGEHRGAKFVGHGGGDRGVDNYVAWYPQQRLAIAVLCNRDEIGAHQLTRRIADLYITEPAERLAASTTPTVPRVSISSEQLHTKAALYREVGGETFVRIFVRDGELRGSPGTGTGDSFSLTPVSETRFAIAGTPFAFEFGPPAPGRTPSFRSFVDQTQNGVFEPVEPFAPSASQLRSYAGAYASPELDVTWTIAARDSGLVIQRPGKAVTVVEPLASDMFTTIGDFMKFSRDSRGDVNGLTLVSTGVRSLRFERVNR